MSGWGARVGGVLLDVAPVLAVATVVFFLIRLHLADCYPVPSDSMEPTIHGDRLNGDLVLVNKTAWWWGRRPMPFDLVVVTGNEPGDNLMVKRCVATGPAKLRLADGDLYIADSEGVFTAPVTKDPVEHADMRVPVFRYPSTWHAPCEQVLEEFVHLPPGHASRSERGEVTVRPSVPDLSSLLPLLTEQARRKDVGSLAPRIPGLIVTNKSIDTSYLTPAGRREWRAINYYADIGVELDVEVGGAAGFVFVLEYRHRDYVLVWEPSAANGSKLSLIVEGEVRQTWARPEAIAGRHALVFGYLDGRLFLLDGTQTLLTCPLALSRHHEHGPNRPNGLQFGAIGSAGSYVIRGMRIFHDVPVTAQAGAGRDGDRIDLEAGQMCLLGDNAHDSADSRGSMGPVSVDRLVGRPAFVLGPRNRMRSFAR